MAPQLKRFFGGLVMFLASIGAAAWTSIDDYWFWRSQPTAAPFVVIIEMAAMVIGVMLFGGVCDEAKLTLRWWRLKLGPSVEFPRTKEETEDYKAEAARRLRSEADGAARLFAIRDQAKESLGTHIKNCTEGSWTLRLKRTRELQRLYNSHNASASSFWNHFLKLWDLFRDMEVLPLNPRTNQPWLDPKAFYENNPGADAGMHEDGKTLLSKPKRQRRGPSHPRPKCPPRPEPMELKKA